MKDNEEAKVDTSTDKTSLFNKEANNGNLSNREPKRYKVKSKTELITLDNEETNQGAHQEASNISIKKNINKNSSDNDADNNNASSTANLGVGMSIQER